MDYVKPDEVVNSMADSGKIKARLSIPNILIKAMLAGSFLGFATTLAFTASTQTGIDLVGAIIFPVGFVMVLLLNLELATGSFAIIPIATFRKKTSMSLMFRNLSWALVGNLLGSVFYAVLFSVSVTKLGHVTDSLLIEKVITVAETKTLIYQEIGTDGLLVVFVNALLCNWMVTMGATMSFTSKATIGKIVAMWLPVLIFFAQGFEHAVVNMFVIPAGMMLGAEISFSDWWVWNQIPVTIGNFMSGFLFTGLALHLMTKNTNSITYKE